jgi:hypothetical protein
MSSKAAVAISYNDGAVLDFKFDSVLDAMATASRASERDEVQSATVTVTETFTYRNGELEETQAGSYAMPELADLTP